MLRSQMHDSGKCATAARPASGDGVDAGRALALASDAMSTELERAIANFKRLDETRSERALSPEEQERWFDAKEQIELLGTANTDRPPSSRRQMLRVPTELDVTFADAAGFEKAYLRNISEGGVYIETSHVFEIGDRFELNILVEDPGASLELPVEVVWVNASPSAASGLKPGAGVAWLTLLPEQRILIKSIIHRALDHLATA